MGVTRSSQEPPAVATPRVRRRPRPLSAEVEASGAVEAMWKRTWGMRGRVSLAEIAVPRWANPSPRRPSANGFKSPATRFAVDEPGRVEPTRDHRGAGARGGVLGRLAAKDGDTVAVGATARPDQGSAGAPAAKPAAAPRDSHRRALTTTAASRVRTKSRPSVPPKARCAAFNEARSAARALGGPGSRPRPKPASRPPRANGSAGRPRHQGRHAGRDRARRAQPTRLQQHAAAS